MAHLAWYLGLLAVGFPHDYSARDSPPWAGGHCSDVFHSLENELQVADTAHMERWWPLGSLGFCWCLSFRDSAPTDILMNMKRDYRMLGCFDILNKALCLQTAEPNVIKKTDENLTGVIFLLIDLPCVTRWVSSSKLLAQNKEIRSCSHPSVLGVP